jgi:hypothetical protein
VAVRYGQLSQRVARFVETTIERLDLRPCGRATDNFANIFELLVLPDWIAQHVTSHAASASMSFWQSLSNGRRSSSAIVIV